MNACDGVATNMGLDAIRIVENVEYCCRCVTVLWSGAVWLGCSNSQNDAWVHQCLLQVHNIIAWQVAELKAAC